MSITAPHPPPPCSSTPSAASQGLSDLETRVARMRAELETMHAALSHAQQMAALGTITAAIAHEYHNILTPVVSYAQLALAQPQDATTLRHALHKALTGAQRATHISDTLLYLARQAPSPPASREMALCDIVTEAIQSLDRPPTDDDIDVRVDVPHAFPASDAVCFQQVVTNLLLNARQAVLSHDDDDDTAKCISIHGRREDDQLHVSITDTGPGIPEAMLDTLFEPFATETKRPRHDERSRGGTGLGLAICRDLISAAGGQIHARNLPRGGAAFELTVPAKQRHDDEEQA